MVGSNWSREELDALLRAWRDALDAAPHTKSFRLLEFIMQRFAMRCGKDPPRSAGSVEIKRKYMKNMVRVITQFNERSGSKKTWFALPPRERKQWFLLFNAKSYKFANMSEECYCTVKELMKIEEVVLYGSTAGGGSTLRDFDDAEAAEEKEGGNSDDSSDTPVHQRVSDIRVSLVKRKDGSWMARSPESSARYAVPQETAVRKSDASRQHTVFDQLVSAASGARDAVMIDAASDGEDGDESDTSDSGNGHEDDDDDGHDSDLLGDLTPSKLPLHLRRQDNRFDHRLASPRVSANSERDVPNVSRTHSRSSTGVMHSQRSNQRTNADLQQVVNGLERQTKQAKELLDQLRDERNRGQTERDRCQQTRKREDGDVKRILDQIQAREVELRAVREQQKAEYKEQKKILLQLKVVREAQQQGDEAKKRDQEERQQLMELIRLDREDRERFRQERKLEVQEQSRFLKLIQEDQEQRRQDAKERRVFLEQLKRYREALSAKANDEKIQESMVGEHSGEPDERDDGSNVLVKPDEERSNNIDAVDIRPESTSDEPEDVEKAPESASDEPEAAKEAPDVPEAAKEAPKALAAEEELNTLKETKEPEQTEAHKEPMRRATRQSILRAQTPAAPMASRTRSKQTKKSAR
ncbi:hypothetical protein FI667_g16470, partial [Globisporangium splendens]